MENGLTGTAPLSQVQCERCGLWNIVDFLFRSCQNCGTRYRVPSVKVNGGDYVFSVKTKEVTDGWVGEVFVADVHVWTLDAPRKTQDEAYAATRRAVAKAFARLLNG